MGPRCALECALGTPNDMPQPPRLLAPPLRSAVCELRFPRLARDLTREQIDALRNALDDYFPHVEERTGVEFRLTPAGLQNEETRVLQLISPDRAHAVTIGPEQFALETSAYETVDHFVEQWRTVAAPVASVLELKWRERLGTRYVNHLPVDTGDGAVGLEAILAAPLLATVGSHRRTRELLTSNHEERFRQDNGVITVRHGLQRPPEAQPLYVLDFDHYNEQTMRLDIEACAQEIVAFNEAVFDLLRWAVTEEQFRRFQPEED
jgi:uncharacterized protein (TIGR04255 family)